MITKRIFVAGLLASVSALLGASAAHAGTTSYPGSLCVQNQKTWSTTALFYMGPEVTTLTAATTISCPISQQGGNISAAAVSGHIYGQTGVACGLYVRDKYDDSGFSSATVTGPAAITSQHYSIDLHPFPHFFADGTKSVLCTLPSASIDFNGTVATYTITEG